jgi:hypothetical protein
MKSYLNDVLPATVQGRSIADIGLDIDESLWLSLAPLLDITRRFIG